jgi:uncharacterized lipoprotein YbaY/heat shock protein HslJ
MITAKGLIMMCIRYWLALCTLILLSLPGAAAAQASAKVTGEVLYRERIALPPSAIVNVQLEDVSLADAPSVVIAEQQIDPMGKGPPYAFELTYDPAKIDQRFSYAVRAEIKDGDKLLFTTTQRYAVITQGNLTSGIQIVVQSVGAAPAPQPQCFSETGHCVGGRFLQYWQQNGGLAVFGYPLSDEVAVLGHTAQYFERQRFELHSENAAPDDVLLGRLGDEMLRRRGTDWQTQPKAAGAQAGCRFFPETQHNACNLPGGPGFLTYWSNNGLEFDGRRGKSYAESLALFGLPLTEPQQETNASGDTVLTQWFERARFEYHPDNPAAYRVLLGRLGAEVMGLAPSPGIVDTTWRLESFGAINAQLPAAAKPATITFGSNGNVSGSTGCNGYGGSYTVQGDRLTFGPIVGTLIACAEEDITQQERELLGALQGTVRYDLAGGKLRIFYAADSKVLVFVTAPASSSA